MVPSDAALPHSRGTTAKFFSRSVSSGAETPTIRNASRFSMRYSISSTPFMVIVKHRGEKDFTAAPGSRAAEGGMPWTAWKARLKAVGD